MGSVPTKKMVEVRVKTIWMGKIAIRDKYFFLAKTKKEDLLIKVDKDGMKIPFAELEDRVVARSERPVIDKFSDNNDLHYLIYFDWEPTNEQAKLL